MLVRDIGGIAVACLAYACIVIPYILLLGGITLWLHHMLFQCLHGALCSVLFGLCARTHFDTMTTDPGRVRDEAEHQERMIESDSQYCDACEKSRPHSALHCSTCKSCILLQDHHCPWMVRNERSLIDMKEQLHRYREPQIVSAAFGLRVAHVCVRDGVCVVGIWHVSPRMRIRKGKDAWETRKMACGHCPNLFLLHNHHADDANVLHRARRGVGESTAVQHK